MNIESESGTIAVASLCGSETAAKRVTYNFVEPIHALYLGKKEIIQEEIEACERLAKYEMDDGDRQAVEKELSELQMALDLLT